MDATSIGILVGAICGAVGTLVGGVLTLWWTKGNDAAIKRSKADTDAKVKIIEAEADAKHRSQSDVIIQLQNELEHKESIIVEKTEIIASHEKRIVKLEADYEKLRETGHNDRNAWFKEQLECHKQQAALEARLGAQQSQLLMQQNQLNTLLSMLKPPPHVVQGLGTKESPMPVTIENSVALSADENHPVPVRRVDGV